MGKRTLAVAATRVLGLVMTPLLALEVGCGGQERPGQGAEFGDPTGAVCPDTSSLTYDNFGRQFVEDYCLRCHSRDLLGSRREGAPLDHNFDSHFECQALADHMDQMAGSGPDATNLQMPPDAPRPSTAERRKLSEWLACGAP
jgi:hypothetical protein